MVLSIMIAQRIGGPPSRCDPGPRLLERGIGERTWRDGSHPCRFQGGPSFDSHVGWVDVTGDSVSVRSDQINSVCQINTVNSQRPLSQCSIRLVGETPSRDRILLLCYVVQGTSIAHAMLEGDDESELTVIRVEPSEELVAGPKRQPMTPPTKPYGSGPRALLSVFIRWEA